MEDVFCRQNPANNIANQRYLAEEFLANCADAKVKPSWWKELIAKLAPGTLSLFAIHSKGY